MKYTPFKSLALVRIPYLNFNKQPKTLSFIKQVNSIENVIDSMRLLKSIKMGPHISHTSTYLRIASHHIEIQMAFITLMKSPEDFLEIFHTILQTIHITSAFRLMCRLSFLLQAAIFLNANTIECVEYIVNPLRKKKIFSVRPIYSGHLSSKIICS